MRCCLFDARMSLMPSALILSSFVRSQPELAPQSSHTELTTARLQKELDAGRSYTTLTPERWPHSPEGSAKSESVVGRISNFYFFLINNCNAFVHVPNKSFQ